MSLSTELAVFRFFDLHVSAVPLLEPRVVKPAAHFFYNENSYAAAQRRCTVESLGSFAARPITRGLRHDYFWRSYLATRLPETQPGIETYWQLMLPFRLTPKGIDLRVEMESPRLDCTVGTEILLWPTGWSTNIVFSVGHPSDLDELTALSQAIRRHEPPPFRWNRRPVALTTVFKSLSEMLRTELFADPDAVYGPCRIPRYGVTLLTSSDPTYSCYDSMTGANRSDLVSVLLGRETEIAERVALQEVGRLLVTSLSRQDFAITDFDRGVLISAANSWPNKGRAELKCLASNVRKALLMSFGLLYTLRLDARVPRPLLEGASRTLRRLAAHYNNPVLHSFLSTHSSFTSISGNKENKAS